MDGVSLVNQGITTFCLLCMLSKTPRNPATQSPRIQLALLFRIPPAESAQGCFAPLENPQICCAFALNARWQSYESQTYRHMAGDTISAETLAAIFSAPVIPSFTLVSFGGVGNMMRDQCSCLLICYRFSGTLLRSNWRDIIPHSVAVYLTWSGRKVYCFSPTGDVLIRHGTCVLIRLMILARSAL